MTIHYHGTPLTPRAELEKMKGKHLCVSFANPGDAGWALAFAQSVLWDNGAFTFKTQGNPVDWAKFYIWLEARLGHPHWAVIPDIIDGSVDDQRTLVRQWPFANLGAPVWHMGLPIEYLLELAERWPRICFGSSGEFWQVGSPRWAFRCDEAFNALETRGLRPWIHMLRGLAVIGDRWPFGSADSVNVARNFKDSNSDPERMARRIDSIQSPIRWIVRVTPDGDFVSMIAMNRYVARFSSTCPNDGEVIHYELTVQTVDAVIMAEDIVAACAEFSSAFHEAIADALHAKLGWRQILRATHGGVEITTFRP